MQTKNKQTSGVSVAYPHFHILLKQKENHKVMSLF